LPQGGSGREQCLALGRSLLQLRPLGLTRVEPPTVLVELARQSFLVVRRGTGQRRGQPRDGLLGVRGLLLDLPEASGRG
jgi:hypothetical protein